MTFQFKRVPVHSWVTCLYYLYYQTFGRTLAGQVGITIALNPALEEININRPKFVTSYEL